MSKYEILTIAYVASREIGDIITTKDLIPYVTKHFRKISYGKAAQMLDACNEVEAIRDGTTPRKWRRVS